MGTTDPTERIRQQNSMAFSETLAIRRNDYFLSNGAEFEEKKMGGSCFKVDDKALV